MVPIVICFSQCCIKRRSFWQALHKTGARKFALTGLSLVGCIPRQIELHGRKGSSKCVEEENEAVVIFNDNIKSLVDQFNNDLSLKNAKFIYINNALISSDNPLLPGNNFLISCKYTFSQYISFNLITNL